MQSNKLRECLKWVITVNVIPVVRTQCQKNFYKAVQKQGNTN